jgi:hypothetical protein
MAAAIDTAAFAMAAIDLRTTITFTGASSMARPITRMTITPIIIRTVAVG